ncbi:nickel pincer cofactor biosynthesis protein LarC [Thermococci archaeon]|nr:MAG: nickel pincer cofactor biosynthesis protein LarC [Thermococci archaeon]
MGFVLFLDPFSGISGDMFLGLLIDLGLNTHKLKQHLDKLELEYELEVKKVNKNGIIATKAQFKIPKKEHHEDHLTHHKHHGVHLAEIYKTLEKLDEPIMEKVRRMFNSIAEAESRIHGIPKEKLHFHEVGATDAILELATAAIGIQLLDIEKIYSNPVNVGSGFVTIKHGRYPVPAPATAEILRGVPIRFDPSIQAELVTPTGAAILKELVDEFAPISFTVEKVGYGAGEKDLEIPNVLRGFLGHSNDEKPKKIIVLETNIDNMNPEFYGYLMDKLFERGALDVGYMPIFMKKNRPGVRVSVVCPIEKKDEIIKTLLSETTSLGIRVYYPERIEAEREIKEIETEYGKAKVKIARYCSRIVNVAPEYESCRSIAERSGKPLKFIYNYIYQKAKEQLNLKDF